MLEGRTPLRSLFEMSKLTSAPPPMDASAGGTVPVSWLPAMVKISARLPSAPNEGGIVPVNRFFSRESTFFSDTRDPMADGIVPVSSLLPRTSVPVKLTARPWNSADGSVPNKPRSSRDMSWTDPAQFSSEHVYSGRSKHVLIRHSGCSCAPKAVGTRTASAASSSSTDRGQRGGAGIAGGIASGAACD